MKINHIASGSSGNCILVEDGQSKIVFDAGLSYNKIKNRIKFSEVSAVFISHEHGDHSKAVPELLRRGVRVFASLGTASALKQPEIEPMAHGNQVKAGSFYVKAFDTIHDAEEPLGFLFQSMVEGKGIYIADSAYVQYDFKGITHFVIECNFAEDLLEEGKDPGFLKNRIRNTHFSFERLQEFFELSDLSKAEEIHLVHLSDRNSHAERFVDEIQKQTGIPTYVLQ